LENSQELSHSLPRGQLLLVGNPYESPRSIDLQANGASPLKDSFLRGGMWAVVWGGAAFLIAPLLATIASITFNYDWNQQSLSEIGIQYKKLSGIGIFLGLLFSLAALANYTSARRVEFIRTLLLTLLAFFISSFLVFMVSIRFGWPLSPPPQRYNYEVTLAERFWDGAWAFSGSVLFTIYLLWRRCSAPTSPATTADNRA
jgi:hypothetical protein